MKTASLAVLPALLLMLAASPQASAFTADPPIVVPNEKDLKQVLKRPPPNPGADKAMAAPVDWSPAEEELTDMGYRREPGAIEELKPSPSPAPDEKKPEKKVEEPKAAPKAAPAAPAASSPPTLDAPKLEMPKLPAAPGVQVGPGGI
ncbi:MAG: hypothetical protein JWM80_5679 [Cyanobacteria bacterium RYN_339]|nr:hypothetical protein [Cyanobacteria bacterium RYN_339]